MSLLPRDGTPSGYLLVSRNVTDATRPDRDPKDTAR